MFIILLLSFIILPIAEIALLLKVGSAVGALNTIGFVIFTAILGAYLVRQQGLSTLARLQQETNAGRMPAKEIAEGVILLVAGAVLLTPGFITDAIGFALLVPAVRSLVIQHTIKRMVVVGGTVQADFGDSFRPGATTQNKGKSSNSNQNVIIEGRYRDAD